MDLAVAVDDAFDVLVVERKVESAAEGAVVDRAGDMSGFVLVVAVDSAVDVDDVDGIGDVHRLCSVLVHNRMMLFLSSDGCLFSFLRGTSFS